MPFVPGTGTNNLDETVRLTRSAAKLGVDAALVIVPYYNRPSQEGLYWYFRQLADAVDLPLILYKQVVEPRPIPDHQRHVVDVGLAVHPRRLQLLVPTRRVRGGGCWI